jgi:hypothetical protein
MNGRTPRLAGLVRCAVASSPTLGRTACSTVGLKISSCRNEPPVLARRHDPRLARLNQLRCHCAPNGSLDMEINGNADAKDHTTRPQKDSAQAQHSLGARSFTPDVPSSVSKCRRANARLGVADRHVLSCRIKGKHGSRFHMSRRDGSRRR